MSARDGVTWVQMIRSVLLAALAITATLAQTPAPRIELLWPAGAPAAVGSSGPTLLHRGLRNQEGCELYELSQTNFLIALAAEVLLK